MIGKRLLGPMHVPAEEQIEAQSLYLDYHLMDNGLFVFT